MTTSRIESESPGSPKAVVMVAKAECLRCGHLAGSLGSEEFDCLGDEGCPARYYRIALGIPVHKRAREIGEAMSSGDAPRLAELCASLSQVDPAIGSKVMDLALGDLRESAGA